MKKLLVCVITGTLFSSAVMANWVSVATTTLWGYHHVHFRISDSEAKAQQLAIEACGHSSCHILYQKQDICLAGAVAPKGGKVTLGEGNTIQKAHTSAMTQCQEVNRGLECIYAGYGCSNGSFRDY